MANNQPPTQAPPILILALQGDPLSIILFDFGVGHVVVVVVAVAVTWCTFLQLAIVKPR
jgi:hypothetical protein